MAERILIDTVEELLKHFDKFIIKDISKEQINKMIEIAFEPTEPLWCKRVEK